MVTFIVLYFSGQTLERVHPGGLPSGSAGSSTIPLWNSRTFTPSQPHAPPLGRDPGAPRGGDALLASTITTVVSFSRFSSSPDCPLAPDSLTITIAISLFTSFFVSRTVTRRFANNS